MFGFRTKKHAGLEVVSYSCYESAKWHTHTHTHTAIHVRKIKDKDNNVTLGRRASIKVLWHESGRITF